MKIPFLLFVGEDEVQKELYRLKDLRAETETETTVERIVSLVSDHRRGEEEF